MTIKNGEDIGVFEFGHDTLTHAEFMRLRNSHRANNPRPPTPRRVTPPARGRQGGAAPHRSAFYRNPPSIQHVWDACVALWNVDRSLLPVKRLRHSEHPAEAEARRAAVAWIHDVAGYSWPQVAFLIGVSSHDSAMRLAAKADPAMVAELADALAVPEAA